MINLYGIGVTLQSAFYKIIHKEGVVSVLEYSLFRDLSILSMAGMLLCYKSRNP